MSGCFFSEHSAHVLLTHDVVNEAIYVSVVFLFIAVMCN